MMGKVDVNGDKAHPLWKWLTAEAPGILGTKSIKWNFTKFLVGKRRQGDQALRAERHAANRSAATSRRRSPPDRRPTMFEHVEPFAGDPILSLNEDFQKDPRPHKINLSIGIYFDDAGRIPVLDSVRRAEQQVVARDARQALPADRRRGQLPRRGAGAAVRRRPRGARRRAGRDDPVGGLERRPQGRRRLHRPLAARAARSGSATRAGRTIARCSKAPASRSTPIRTTTPRPAALAFDAMCAALRAPAGEERRPAARLLPQPDRRRPDARAVGRAGADPAPSASCVPYLDLAYQGFGDGIVEDAYALRALAAARGRDGRPLAFFVANSFSKSMSLYGERCGALSVVCADAGEATQRPRPAQVHGPPQLLEPADPRRPDRRRGARASRRCGATWEAELAAMRERIQAMRQGAARRPRGQGARSRLRLLPDASAACSATPACRRAQVDRLREEFAVYLVRSGRMCVAGLNTRQRRGDGAGDGGGARRLSRARGAISGAAGRRSAAARTAPGRWRRWRSDRRAPAAPPGTRRAAARSAVAARSSRR